MIDILFLVESSITDNNVLEAIKESIKEIISELQSSIGMISLFTFGNSPSLNQDWIESARFILDKSLVATPGMCNVHFALNHVAGYITSSKGKSICIFLYLSSDFTDSERLLNENSIGVISRSNKFLIKSKESILEPKGFDGCLTFILGSDDEMERLILNLKNISAVFDSHESHLRDKESSYHSQATENEKESSSLNMSENTDILFGEQEIVNNNAKDLTSAEEELPSPDIYN